MDGHAESQDGLPRSHEERYNGSIVKKNKPAFFELRSSLTFIVTVISFSGFTDHFLYTLIIPILPEVIVNRAGVRREDSQKWISIIMMAEPAIVTVSSPILGYIVDLTPHRTPYYWAGLIALIASNVVMTAALSVHVLIVGRLIQGIASAMLYIVGRAILVDAAPANGMGHYAGYMGAFKTLGFAIGPVVGGPLYYGFGYYAVMALGFSLIAVDLFLRVMMIEKSVADEYRPGVDGHMDTDPLLNHVDHEHNTVHIAPESEATLTSSGNTSRWHALKILRKPRFVLTLWATTVHGLVYSAFDTVLPKYVEDTFHWTSLEAGLILLPAAIPALGEPLFGWLADKIGVRPVAVAGFGFLAPALVALGFIEHNSMPIKVVLCGLLALMGLFADMTEPAVVVEGAAILDGMKRRNPDIFGVHGAVAQLFSLQTSSFFFGLLVGPAWGGFLMIAAGWSIMCWSLGLLAAVTSMSMLWLGDVGVRRLITGRLMSVEARKKSRDKEIKYCYSKMVAYKLLGKVLLTAGTSSRG